MRSPDDKARKALKLLAAVLIGPALLCSTLWYAQRFTPPADPTTPADDRSGTDAGVPPARSGYIPVNEALPAGQPAEVLGAAKQVVPVLAKFDNNETTLGSAFVYATGVIVTAAHVVDAYGLDHLIGIWVYCDGRTEPAEVLAADLLRDTAILSAGCSGETLPLAHQAIKAGQRLYVSGYDFGEAGAVRYLRPAASRYEAEVSFQPPDTADPRFVMIIQESARLKVPRVRAIDIQLVSGNSGSLVIDEAGAVVGMVMLVDRRQKLTFYAPAANIRHVLCQAGVE